MTSSHPPNSVNQPIADSGEKESPPAQPPRRQRCQQCQALVMPAALNDLLRCLSCTGQLDLFSLTETAANGSRS